MTHLSLFSGVGGLDIAAEWAGFETVGQCEYADYPTKVLEKHWPDVPRWRDIRTLTAEAFFERTGLRTVDVISGGFPCQPFSVAGKRRGKSDDRFLWPEMVRVIKELRPAWVVGENVAGIVNMALDEILSELDREGYAARTFLFPAHAVGAWHLRYRVAIVGNADEHGRNDIMADAHSKRRGETREHIDGQAQRTISSGEDIRNADRERCKKHDAAAVTDQAEQHHRGHSAGAGDLSDAEGADGERAEPYENATGRRGLANGDYGCGKNDRGGYSAQEQTGGQLNPAWVEWLMGFPIGWTQTDT